MYHAGGRDFNFSSFGDTPVAIVVNPMDVLNSVENQSKIRFTRFTPVAILKSDAEWIDDKDVHKRVDACYDVALERLDALLTEAAFQDFKKHEILNKDSLLNIGFEDVKNILN